MSFSFEGNQPNETIQTRIRRCSPGEGGELKKIMKDDLVLFGQKGFVFLKKRGPPRV